MKQPNWKIPLVLSFCLLALASFAYWLQFSHKPKTDHAETQSKKPIPLASDDLQILQFRIKSASGVIEGKCNSIAQKTCKVSTLGDWSITYPVNVKGDASNIKDALSNATTMIATEMIDLKDETPEKRKKLLDEYGLSADKRTKVGTEFIELTLEDSTKKTAWFGEPYPVGDKVFVGSSVNGNLDENNIFIVANFYKSVFEKGVTHFRDKTLITFERADITELNGKTTGGTFQAELQNGVWMINGKKGDHDRIETVLSSMSQAKAKDFVPQDLFKGSRSIVQYEFKSKTKAYTFELFEKSSKPIHLKGKPEVPGESHYYVKTNDISEPVEVEATLRAQLDKKVVDLRDALLLSQSEKVTDTDLRFSGKAYATDAKFHFDGKTWSEQTGPKMDPERVTAFLDTISSSRAADIVTPSPPIPNDFLEVFIGDDKNAQKSHFKVYTVKDKTYARDLTSSANEAFLLTPSEKNAFPFTSDSWKLK